MKAKANYSFFKYLRELSVVVIGIAITLTANSWINRQSEKNDLHLYMSALKLEMEENLKLMEDRGNYYAESHRFGEYLAVNHNTPEKVSTDTISKYRYITQNFFFLSYKTSAFEMFKMSGSIRLIKDKKLVQTIWDVYAKMEMLKQESDYYMQGKSSEITQAVATSSSLPIDIRLPENKAVYRYFSNGVDASLKEQCDSCADVIKNVLSHLKGY